MRRALVLALPIAVMAAPVAAQTMDPNMKMPGMSMPAKPTPKTTSKKAKAKPGSGTAVRKPLRPIGRTGQPASASGTAKSASQADQGMSGMKGMQGMDMSHAAPSGQPMQGMAPGQPMQGQDMSAMPGMDMSGSAAAGAGAQPQKQDMATMPGMKMDQSMPGMSMGQPMPGMDMSGVKEMPAGATKPLAGNAPPPPKPTDHAADRIYGPSVMSPSRGALHTEQGGQNFYMVLFNLAEYQFRNGRDGYRWDGQAWYGGDINRFVAKTEGEGAISGGVETAEVQALYSRTIGPYWNVQGGVRYDFKPNPSRTYATVGVQGLAPSFFDVEGALFLSNKGELLARAEGYYDQRITQRLILQPRVELNFAAQNVRETQTGAGLSNAELGLRLRYEIKREFAPYIGVSWDRRIGATARFAREAGEDASAKSLVAGVRMWF